MPAEILDLSTYRLTKQSTCARCGSCSPSLQECLIKGLYTCATGCPELRWLEPVRVLFRTYENACANPPAKSIRKAYEQLLDIVGDNIYQIVGQ
jgi:hypothetical protein